MDLIKEVESIEVPGVRNLEWYYHMFNFSDKKFRDMVTEGIKCRKLINEEPSGNNGHYYISLTKDLGVCDINHAFNEFVKLGTNFIIDGISPIKCSPRMFTLYHLFASTKIKLRSSGWKDEYQEYLKIEPSKFVGLQCPLYNWIVDAVESSYVSDTYFTYNLRDLREMIKIMREYGIELPIFDYSRRDGESVHLIDTDAYLESCDDIIGGVDEVVKKREKKMVKSDCYGRIIM